MDVFTIEAVDMINLTKVMVGHEGEGHGKGWFLDKVIVKESTDAEQQYVFMCERYVTKILDNFYFDGDPSHSLHLSCVQPRMRLL